jgi:CheY-like chemotaxis protein
MKYKVDSQGNFKFSGPVDEATILSVAEKIREARFYRETVLTHPAASRDYLVAKLALLPHEVFAAIFLDNRHAVIAFEILFTGTLDGASVHPREVIKRALHHNAAAVIFAHNHPSGVPEPSAADRSITDELKRALNVIGTRTLDHFIVGGNVALRVSGFPLEDSDLVELRFVVADNGVGIPAHQRERIFEPFRQLDQGPGRVHEGVGLGLYIVRKISDLMHGELRLADNPGGGTVFTWILRLPISPDQSHAEGVSALDSLAVHRELFPPLCCVVFEDMPSNQLVIGRILELAGHSVTFHDRGTDAMAKIAAADADLVFLDLHMPGTSGLEVSRDLARARTTRHVPPVVVLTADVTKRAAEASYASGVAEYLVKPLSATKLLGVIERLHPASEAPRPAPRQVHIGGAV